MKCRDGAIGIHRHGTGLAEPGGCAPLENAKADGLWASRPLAPRSRFAFKAIGTMASGSRCPLHQPLNGGKARSERKVHIL